jgi:hypothetical protein
MRSSCCPCVYASPRTNFWKPEPIIMKFGVIAPEPVRTAYFINLSHQFVCLYVNISYGPYGKVSVKFIQKFTLLSLQDNGSVNTIQPQRKHTTDM